MKKISLFATALCIGFAAAAQSQAPPYSDWEKWQVLDNHHYSLCFVETFNSDSETLPPFKIYDADSSRALKAKEDAYRAVFDGYDGAYESFLRSDLVYYDNPSGEINPARFTVSFPVAHWRVMRPVSNALGELDDMADKDDGFFALLSYDHSLKRYTLAFRGTDLSWRDAFADLSSNLLGNANSQLDKAVKIAALVDALPANIKERMVITGHSLGGGLASLVAVLTGVKADTFNAMGIPDSLIDHYAEEFAKATGRSKSAVLAAVPENKRRIRAFITNTDILNRAQSLANGLSQASDILGDLANSIFGQGTVNTSLAESIITAEALGHHITIDQANSTIRDHLLNGHKLRSFMPNI